MARSRENEPVALERKRLNGAEVEAHLASIAGRARAIELRVKGVAIGYSTATAAKLNEVGRRLRAGDLVAVQIRFFHDDAWWCDTVMRAGESFRLVRMRQDEPPIPPRATR